MAEGKEFEGFVDLGEGIDGVHDPKVQPTGTYDLVVTSAKGIFENDGNGNPFLAKIRCLVDFDGMEGAQTIFHNMSLPKPGDEPKSKEYKIRLVKKFYKLFGAPVTNRGFNTTDIIGARAAGVHVDLKPAVMNDDGTVKYQESNAINLNLIKV